MTGKSGNKSIWNPSTPENHQRMDLKSTKENLGNSMANVDA